MKVLLLTYFKTLSICPAGVELTTSRVTSQCSTNWATGAVAGYMRGVACIYITWVKFLFDIFRLIVSEMILQFFLCKKSKIYMRLAPGELTYVVSFSGGDQICSQKFSRRIYGGS